MSSIDLATGSGRRRSRRSIGTALVLAAIAAALVALAWTRADSSQPVASNGSAVGAAPDRFDAQLRESMAVTGYEYGGSCGVVGDSAPEHPKWVTPGSLPPLVPISTFIRKDGHEECLVIGWIESRNLDATSAESSYPAYDGDGNVLGQYPFGSSVPPDDFPMPPGTSHDQVVAD